MTHSERKCPLLRARTEIASMYARLDRTTAELPSPRSGDASVARSTD